MKTWRQYNFGPFILGTVQLGLPYGIANSNGQPETSQAIQILETAWNHGLRAFDTAQDYGTSQQIIGQTLSDPKQITDALIITKLPQKSFADQQSVFQAMEHSLKELGRSNIFGLLAHSAEALKNTKKSQTLFAALKNSGYVTYTGVSVYDVDEAQRALECEHFDLIQLPLNALDRRPINSNLIAKAQEHNKLMMFRSAYLQGLLLMDPGNGLPENLEFARSILQTWWTTCRELGISPRQAALAISHFLAGPFPLVIGAESANQVVENVTNIKKSLPQLPELLSLTESISHNCPERLLNPSLW